MALKKKEFLLRAGVWAGSEIKGTLRGPCGPRNAKKYKQTNKRIQKTTYKKYKNSKNTKIVKIQKNTHINITNLQLSSPSTS